MELVREKGEDWTYIGKVMDRSAENVYDKFRQIKKEKKCCNWNLREYIQLLILVNSRLKDKFLDLAIKNER